MYSFTWVSPNPAQKLSPKQFAITIRSELDVTGLLDLTAAALAELNGGQLWRSDGRLIPRPEICPEALEYPATCSYGAHPRQGRLMLECVVQPPIAPTPNQLGLVLTFGDQRNSLGPQWMEQISELIVAQTVVHVGTSVARRLGYANDADNPCERWTYLMGAWGSGGGAFFNYNAWHIILGR